MNFSAYPMARVGLIFMLGILSRPYFSFSGLHGLLSVVFLLLALWFFLKKYRFSLRYFESVLVLLLIFFLGYYIHEISIERVKGGDLQEGEVTLTGFVETKAVKGFNHSKLVLSYKVADSSSRNLVKNKKILILCGKPDATFYSYKSSDFILVKGKLRNIRSSTNPGSFDKKSFYFYKGITQEIFIDSLSHQLVNKGSSPFIIKFVENISTLWLNKIELWITGVEERAIIKALLLGNKDEIDKDLYLSFSQTGAIHVLAVSGLHVGAVLYLFMYLFRIMPQYSWIRWFFKPFLISVIAFIYVLLTGASPSVIRSSVMFILLLVGREWFKSVHIINILFVAAIWMLLYDPFLIYNLSFQFSYLSLAGIILFYPFVKILFIPSNKGLGYIWELIAVSVSAQFFVFPFALYYFHQFPVYFILSNIVAVPATLILVNAGIVMFLLSLLIPLQNTFVTGIYQSVCTFLWKSVTFVQELPFSVIDDIWIEPWQVFILCMTVVLLLIYLNYEKTVYFYIILLLIIVFILSVLVPRLVDSGKIRFSVYETNFGYLADVLTDDVVFVFKNQAMRKEQENFLAQNNRTRNTIKKTIEVESAKTYFRKKMIIQSPVLRTNHKRLLMLGKDFQMIKDTFSDMVMVTKGSFRSPYEILKNIKPTFVILSPDVERYKVSSWESCLEEMNIPYWNVKKQGYFFCNL
ncbi:MAG: ComEC/Rec2 family competence protein [Saprospiraceae bacterium]|nr:ComEC/Rec2 family competence protein [Saprospiraceae bacterium]